MDAWVWIVIAIAVVVAIAIAVAVVAASRRRRRTNALRDTFGDEYDRRVRDEGSRRRAESQLVDLRDRHEQLQIMPLTPATRSRFLDRWQEVQSRFLDQPGHALDAADVLVREVLAARGYPTGDFDEESELVGYDHPEAVRHYRAAHDTLERARAGMSGTEEVRVAMIQYRSLFETLLAAPAPQAEPGRAQDPARAGL
jgi:hypothetical protein